VQLDVEVNGTQRRVVVTRTNGRFFVTMAGREWAVDMTTIGKHLLSLLIEDRGAAALPEHVPSTPSGPARITSRELSVAADAVSGQLVFGVGPVPLAASVNNRRRRFGRRDDAHASSGPQRIVAPMPGKIVRVLGQVGEPVAQRQPVVVIEAMKMENELRAARAGTLSELLVHPGQSVEAGTLLAIITPA
jgi:biotin carboxyl carrier protein